VRAQAREQGAEDPGACLGVGERAVRDVDLDPERVGQQRQLARALQRQHGACERRSAQHRRVGPLQADAAERLTQDPAVERGAVRDHHPPLQKQRERRKHGLGVGRGIDLVLCDAREALDSAPERHVRAYQRLPPVVQLAAADEHRADLGQLAGIAPEAIRLGVDDDELGARQRLL
jgi:hypothetical protein